MAANVKKTRSLNAKGILDASDGTLKLEVEGFDEPMSLYELMQEFDGLLITLTAKYNEEIYDEMDNSEYNNED